MKIFLKLLVAIAFIWTAMVIDDAFVSTSSTPKISSAEAVVGRPASPVSYAGVARRSPVGVNRVGNRGGPVNRVGRR